MPKTGRGGFVVGVRMPKPLILRCDPFAVGLAIATKPRHLAWLERRFPGVDFDPSPAAWTADVLDTENPSTYDLVVWVDRKFWRESHSRAVVAAHEGAHVARFVLDHIGEQPTKEVHAYLTDWAAGHIWDALHSGERRGA